MDKIDAASNRNQNLIGATFFIKDHEASGASSGVLSITMINDTMEYRSPRDADSHGTHMTSTTARRYAL